MSSESNPAKPKLACEIAADRVLVGRLAEDRPHSGSLRGARTGAGQRGPGSGGGQFAAARRGDARRWKRRWRASRGDRTT